VQLAAASIVTVGAIALGAWLTVSRLRQRELQAELILACERGAQHERLAQLGAGLAHETKNPLGIVRGLAQSIGGAPQADEHVRRLAGEIVDEADRTVGRINSFLTLARPKEVELRTVDVDAFFEHMRMLVQPEADRRSVTLTVNGDRQHIVADEDLLRRAVLNLLVNAIRASEGGGAVAARALRDGDTTTLEVRDDGCGITPEDLPRVTEPYFTRFEGGTGLGLSIVEQIARAHGWGLKIASEVGEGTQVSLRGMKRVECAHDG
ncbi:MAG TPA: hypothetical protein ENN80_11720, partial [Candidatus Hydrogenedentes bacterium]|nr:hypothetical protein [Candidatus Hydrogenedentota bacterium]